VTTANDARITRVGRLLRRTKLDEVPQLLNVLIGDMSLVGPRPEVPRYVAMYPEAARQEILGVRPGLTDLASIEFRNEQDLLALAPDPEWTYVNEIMPRKIALCRQYVRERSMLLDLRILARTVLAVMC
jgi:lipopolysaccharide/colanic/teichoic acid biosynthesis glycosyltransferase